MRSYAIAFGLGLILLLSATITSADTSRFTRTRPRAASTADQS